MGTRFLTLLLLATAILSAQAQDACQYGSEAAADSLVSALKQAPTCKAAAAKLRACEWGSSADTQFAPIVVAKCEKTFFDGLAAAGKKRYEDEMQMCAYEYAKAEGTLAMSKAAMCQVDVAAAFAAKPELAGQPEPRASFDCGGAHTLLEKAICSDVRLGRADIILSRVYMGVLKSAENDAQDRSLLEKSERQWLEDIPGRCHLGEPFSEQALGCVRNAFEDRFTALGGCEGPMSDCLNSLSPGSSEVDAQARASFDCEKPSTGLEIVICADADLGKTDLQLAQAYHDAGAALGEEAKAGLTVSERHWLTFVGRSCPLGVVGGIPSVLTRACVRTAFETRIRQLQECPQKPAVERNACLNQFALGVRAK